MNLVTMAQTLGWNPHPAFGLAMAAAIGLEREYPDRLPISTYLNPEGIAARDAMANMCTEDILAVGAGHSAGEYSATTLLTDNPDAVAVVAENSLELYDGMPRIPMFEWHSPTDRLVPLDAIVATDHRWCDDGVRLQALQVTAPDEHLSAAVLGLPEVFIWLDARFRGEPTPSTC
jgi:hypothetical protein